MIEVMVIIATAPPAKTLSGSYELVIIFFQAIGKARVRKSHLFPGGLSRNNQSDSLHIGARRQNAA